MTPEEIAVAMARATRPRRTVPIVTDGEVREQIEDLDDELNTMESVKRADRRLGSRPTGSARVAEIQQELAELEERAKASILYVVCEGMESTLWQALLAQHPPRVDTEGNQVPGDRSFGANVETIREPAIRACVIGHRPTPKAEPILLGEGVLDWLIGWMSDGQKDLLWMASLAVCRGDVDVPLSRARLTTQESASA